MIKKMVLLVTSLVTEPNTFYFLLMNFRKKNLIENTFFLAFYL